MWFAYTTVLEGRRKGQTSGSGNQLLVAEWADHIPYLLPSSE